jgi:hypothetical protein
MDPLDKLLRTAADQAQGLEVRRWLRALLERGEQAEGVNREQATGAAAEPAGGRG